MNVRRWPSSDVRAGDGIRTRNLPLRRRTPYPLGHTGMRAAFHPRLGNPGALGKRPLDECSRIDWSVRWDSCLRQRTPTPMRPDKTHPPMPRGTHPHGNKHPGCRSSNAMATPMTRGPNTHRRCSTCRISPATCFSLSPPVQTRPHPLGRIKPRCHFIWERIRHVLHTRHAHDLRLPV